jgi:hypothetical protein
VSLSVPADIIHDANQANICLDEYILPLRAPRLAFRYNAISGFLRAANKIGAGLAGMLRELLTRRLADEDGDDNQRKRGGHTGIRGLDVREGDHWVVLTEE